MNYDLHGIYEVIIGFCLFAAIPIAYYLCNRFKETIEDHSRSFR